MEDFGRLQRLAGVKRNIDLAVTDSKMLKPLVEELRKSTSYGCKERMLLEKLLTMQTEGGFNTPKDLIKAAGGKFSYKNGEEYLTWS